MAASAPIACASDTWVKIATGVTSAVIHKLSVRPSLYIWTYVVTLAAAPINDDNAVPAFNGCGFLEFSDGAASDVYIKAVKYDGSVRVDL